MERICLDKRGSNSTFNKNIKHLTLNVIRHVFSFKKKSVEYVFISGDDYHV